MNTCCWSCPVSGNQGASTSQRCFVVPRGMGGPLSTLCLIIPLAVGWKVLDVNGREASPVQLHSYMSRGFTRGPRNARQSQVVQMMKHAWNAGYAHFCFGADEFKPVSTTCSNGWRMGLTLVDSLDTLHLMGLEEEFAASRAWIANATLLNFSQVGNVNLFEVTIRELGGLLGAATLTGDAVFIDRARELGDRLMPAFTDAFPFSDIDLERGVGSFKGASTSIGEAGTLGLEFKTLSQLTGQPKFAQAVERVASIFHESPTEDGLLCNSLPKSEFISLGSRGDSYYEYLLKQWLLTGKREERFLHDYINAIEGVRRNLVRHTGGPMNLTYIQEVNGLKGGSYAKMDHLVCFLPGLLALGVANGAGPDVYLDLAKELLRTCHEMYVATGTNLGPEIARFDEKGKEIWVSRRDAHCLLRPETLESYFYLWRITGDKMYQDWGAEVMDAIERHAKVETGGYTSLDNTLPNRAQSSLPKLDKMESFFTAETLKYLFLLFDDEGNQLPLDEFILSTEAHPFRAF